MIGWIVVASIISVAAIWIFNRGTLTIVDGESCERESDIKIRLIEEPKIEI